MENKGLSIPKVHSLTKLYGTIEHVLHFPIDMKLLQKADAVYTVSRYPADIGLLTHGKPSEELATSLYEFAKYVFEETRNMIS